MPLIPRPVTAGADNAPERTVQASIFDVFAAHEIGHELKAMLQWLDKHRHLLGLVARDLHRDGFQTTGRQRLPAEAVLRCALLKQYRQLSCQELAYHHPRGALVVASQHRTVHRPLTPATSLPKQAVRCIERKDVTMVRWDDHRHSASCSGSRRPLVDPSRTPHDALGAVLSGIGGSSESATLTASVIPKATKSAFRSRASASEVSPSSFSAPGADQNTIPTRDAGRVRFSRLTTNLACLSELVLRNPTTIA